VAVWNAGRRFSIKLFWKPLDIEFLKTGSIDEGDND
jgi:hypothetical protein